MQVQAPLQVTHGRSGPPGEGDGKQTKRGRAEPRSWGRGEVWAKGQAGAKGEAAGSICHRELSGQQKGNRQSGGQGPYCREQYLLGVT